MDSKKTMSTATHRPMRANSIGASPSSAAATVRLDAVSFDRIFPFHLLLDSELRIRSCGPVINRLLPELDRLPVSLMDCFQFTTPGLESFDRMARSLHRSVVLRAKKLPALQLRGQFVPINQLHRLAFIASPRLSSTTMAALGLTLDDFPPHDGIADYLALFEAQRIALADSARLSEDLARLNADLDARVAARAREFEAANEQLRGTSKDLAATLEELRAAKAQLELEMAERLRVEAELRIAHRLEAVGQLAAGIAHEINTPIQYVSDSVHFVRDALSDLMPLLQSCASTEAWEDVDGDFLVERLPEAIQRSLDGLERVAKIVRAMKAFAHPGSAGKEPADVNATLENTLSVSRNEYKYVADVVTELGEIPLVTCNIAELGQVFLNLIVNAAHAIAGRVEGTSDRGHITVKTFAEDDAVVVQISDDGAGMPEAIWPRIFDPFFTTKPVGKGTGQGLPITRNIIVKHGGTIAFTSQLGQGTTFVVRLPLTPTEGGHAAHPAGG